MCFQPIHPQNYLSSAHVQYKEILSNFHVLHPAHAIYLKLNDFIYRKIFKKIHSAKYISWLVF